MYKRRSNSFILSLLFVAAFLLGARGVKASPEKGVVYFGLLKSVDTVNRVIHMEVLNTQAGESLKKKEMRSFLITPDAKIGIEQPNGKTMQNMTLHNVATCRWVWVDSRDGEISWKVTATPYVSYRGYLVEAEGNQITLKLNMRRVGSRRNGISEKTPPRKFSVLEDTPCFYKGKQISPSLIGPNTYLEVTSLEDGGVVLINVLDG
jgi:hypothetical protein